MFSSLVVGIPQTTEGRKEKAEGQMCSLLELGPLSPPALRRQHSQLAGRQICTVGTPLAFLGLQPADVSASRTLTHCLMLNLLCVSLRGHAVGSVSLSRSLTGCMCDLLAFMVIFLQNKSPQTSGYNSKPFLRLPARPSVVSLTLGCRSVLGLLLTLPLLWG